MPSQEEAKTEEGAVKPTASKGPMVKWILMGVILLAFVGIEAGMAIFFVNKLKPHDNTLEAVEKAQEEQKEAQAKQTEMGLTLEKPIDVTVNIAETNGERFLKAAVQLEWSSSDAMLGEELQARLPKIKNIIIDILSSKPLADLMTVEGKKAIRESIVADINAVLPTEVAEKSGDAKPLGRVERAFFVEFIVQ
ncbi:MAG TPA: flagellar basal body-associated FliL family protein [Fibrobacteraceae bacterium]|nr:flagellar basal body-associated FliL family protein [Fibrobacteraceae bacterium]